MDKYYNPITEEFHQGFEYERWESFAYTKENWIKEIFKFVDKDGIWLGDDPTNILAVYDNRGDEIRVKYLDKEDIESLGWKFIKQHPGTTDFDFEKESYSLNFDSEFGDKWNLRIYDGENQDNEFNYFSGYIKNKSELIKLLKQLDIE